MSYGIPITNQQGEPLHTALPHHLYGGTYCLDTTELYLNITYNYSPFYYRAETLGESTKVYGDKPVDGCLPVLREEYGGIPGLAYLTIPQARELVLKAIQHLRDEPLDENGNLYEPESLFDGDRIHATSYWAPTEANARRALVNLLQLLCLAPDNSKIQIS